MWNVYHTPCLLHVLCVVTHLAGRPLDMTVAAQPLSAGELALSIPEHLVVTLDRVFESDTLAEMLTAGKLSELACLALTLMYEKKVLLVAADLVFLLASWFLLSAHTRFSCDLLIIAMPSVGLFEKFYFIQGIHF